MKFHLYPNWVTILSTVISIQLYQALGPITAGSNSSVHDRARDTGAVGEEPRRGLQSASAIRILHTVDREGRPIPGGRPEILVGIDNDRAVVSPWYRRRVTNHIAHRYSRNCAAMNSEEGLRLKQLFADHGVTFEYHWEVITQCYDQLNDYHGIRGMSDYHQREESAPDYKPNPDPEIAASIRRFRAALVASNDRAQALIKPILIDRLQQSTGIVDPGFYEELFKIRPRVAFEPIEITVADDEVID